MRGIEASWVWSGEAAALPIAAGAVVFEGARVRGYGRAPELRSLHPEASWERHEGVLIPGLVNARVSIEGSALVPGGAGWVAWMRAGGAREAQDGAGVLRMLAERGTAAIAAVVSTLDAALRLASAPFTSVIQREIAGVRAETAEVMRGLAGDERARTGLACTLSPHSLLALPAEHIEALAAEAEAPMLVRLAFCEAERAYLEEGTGPYAEWLRELDAEAVRWPALSPIDYAASIGVIGPRVVATHLSDARPHELRALAATKTRAVLCPRASAHVEGKLPPLDDVLAAGLEPGLGTDSLACAESADVLDEVAVLHERFVHVPLATVLAMATSWGARAIGVEHAGSFARDRAPGALLFEGAAHDPLSHVLAGGPRVMLVAPGAA